MNTNDGSLRCSKGLRDRSAHYDTPVSARNRRDSVSERGGKESNVREIEPANEATETTLAQRTPKSKEQETWIDPVRNAFSSLNDCTLRVTTILQCMKITLERLLRTLHVCIRILIYANVHIHAMHVNVTCSFATRGILASALLLVLLLVKYVRFASHSDSLFRRTKYSLCARAALLCSSIKSSVFKFSISSCIRTRAFLLCGCDSALLCLFARIHFAFNEMRRPPERDEKQTCTSLVSMHVSELRKPLCVFLCVRVFSWRACTMASAHCHRPLAFCESIHFSSFAFFHCRWLSHRISLNFSALRVRLRRKSQCIWQHSATARKRNNCGANRTDDKHQRVTRNKARKTAVFQWKAKRNRRVVFSSASRSKSHSDWSASAAIRNLKSVAGDANAIKSQARRSNVAWRRHRQCAPAADCADGRNCLHAKHKLFLHRFIVRERAQPTCNELKTNVRVRCARLFNRRWIRIRIRIGNEHTAAMSSNYCCLYRRNHHFWVWLAQSERSVLQRSEDLQTATERKENVTGNTFASESTATGIGKSDCDWDCDLLCAYSLASLG